MLLLLWRLWAVLLITSDLESATEHLWKSTFFSFLFGVGQETGSTSDKHRCSQGTLRLSALFHLEMDVLIYQGTHSTKCWKHS